MEIKVSFQYECYELAISSQSPRPKAGTVPSKDSLGRDGGTCQHLGD